MTLVRNTTLGPDLAPRAGVAVTAHPARTPAYFEGGGTVLRPAVTASDAAGAWELDLAPSSEVLPGPGHWIVEEFDPISRQGARHVIDVPDLDEPVELAAIAATPVVVVDGGTPFSDPGLDGGGA